MQLPLAIPKPHRVYTFHSKSSCDEIKEFMLARMAVLAEGYPEETRAGTVLFDPSVFTKCQNTFVNMDRRKFKIPSFNRGDPNGALTYMSALVEVNADAKSLKWWSTAYKGKEGWKEEYRLSDSKQEDQQIEERARESASSVSFGCLNTSSGACVALSMLPGAPEPPP